MRSHTYSTVLIHFSNVRSNLLFYIGKNKKNFFFRFQTVRDRSYPQLIHKHLNANDLHLDLSTVYTVIHSVYTTELSTAYVHSIHTLIHTVVHTVTHSERHSSPHSIHTVMHSEHTVDTRCSSFPTAKNHRDSRLGDSEARIGS